MRILGIDTSGKIAATALYDAEEHCLLAQQVLFTKRTHSQVILPLVERMLTETATTWEQIDGVAVAIGPGSYTGLRIGIAAVKAISFAKQLPCAGISTLEGLAWQNLSWRGMICPVMQARQTLVYAGLYRSDGREISAMQADHMVEQPELERQLQELGEPVLLVGDAAEMFAAMPSVAVASPMTRLQNGTGICLAAQALKQWQTPADLMPEYLQLVKAEKDLQDREKARTFA